MKLHQLLALLPTIKKNTSRAQTELDHMVQKAAAFKGLSRIYTPREEEGFVHPPESVLVQAFAVNALANFLKVSEELFTLSGTQDLTNCSAKADISIEGVVLASAVPVTHLLFLEKQLIDLKTFITALPILDSDKSWTFDENRGSFVTEPRSTVKTKKITKPVVLYEATKEHPAQVKEASEDIVEGTWTTIDLSGGLSRTQANKYLSNVDTLIKAVISAREEANSIVAQPLNIVKNLFDYVLS